MTSLFPVLQAYTDYVWDPFGVFLAALFSFGISRIFFVDSGTISHWRKPLKGQNAAWFNGPVTWFGEFWPLIVSCLLLALMIGTWVTYGNNLKLSQEALGDPVGLIFPRDVFSLTLSMITFFYVFICGIVLAGGSVMLMRPTFVEVTTETTTVTPGGLTYTAGTTELRVEDKSSFYNNMKVYLAFFQYLFWIGVIGFMAALQNRYVLLNLANYNASFEPTMLNCSNTVLASGIILIFALVTKSCYYFLLNPWDPNKVKASALENLHDGDSPAYTALPAGFMNLILPAERNTRATFVLAVLFNTLAVFLIVYADYLKFEIAGGFIVFASVFFTFFTKNLDTFQFFYMYALWFVTTIPYFTQTLFYKGVGGFTSYMNSAVNVNPLTLEPSQINFPENYPQTLLLFSGLALASSVLHMFSVWYKPSIRVAELNEVSGVKTS